MSDGNGRLWHDKRRQLLGVDPCPECECIPHRVTCSRRASYDRQYEIHVERAGRARAEWDAIEAEYRTDGRERVA